MYVDVCIINGIHLILVRDINVFQALKALLIAILMVGIVPLMLGLLFELIIITPIRVPLDQTPIFFPWQVGFHYEKGVCETGALKCIVFGTTAQFGF